MKKSIEDIIRADPNITEIIPGEKWDFHEIDYSLFKPEYITTAAEFIEEIKEILSNPYIIDNFKDDSTRMKWINQMQKNYRNEFNDFYTRNTLELTKWYSVPNLMEEFCKNYAEEKQPEFNELIGTLQNNMLGKKAAHSEYDSKSISEKIEYIKNIKQATYNILEFLKVSR